MNGEPIEILAYQASAHNLSRITAVSNDSDGSGMWRQWVKDIIPTSDGQCMVIIARQGSYPYMVNQWMEKVAELLPEIQAILGGRARRNKEMQEWEERQRAEVSDRQEME